jgi:hypothetical protein
MEIEVIGLLGIVLGLLMIRLGPGFGIFTLAPASILGAAAAVQLPALGSASVPPAMIVLAFFAITILRYAKLRSAVGASLAFPQPGFWLLLVVAYGVLSGVFLPRIFSGMTHVYSLARTGDDVGIVVLPLEPRASNVTQTLYLMASLVCFAAIAGFARQGGAITIARAVLLTAGLHLLFGLADLWSYATQNQALLSPIRNANYRMLETGEIGGLKRVVGSFSEAAAYSYATIGFFAFSLGLWLESNSPGLTGPLAGLLLLSLALSTSTTAYVTLGIFSLIVFVACIRRILSGQASRQQITYACIAPVVLVALVVGAMLVPAAWAALNGVFDLTITNKLATQSGIERMRWNDQALTAFFDTVGLGAGVGSVRASSFVVAVLANCGVLGLLLFASFLAPVIVPTRQSMGFDAGNSVGRAGAWACLALLIAASISASSIYLGLFFSMFAGVSATARWRMNAMSPLGNQGRLSSRLAHLPVGSVT